MIAMYEYQVSSVRGVSLPVYPGRNAESVFKYIYIYISILPNVSLVYVVIYMFYIDSLSVIYLPRYT